MAVLVTFDVDIAEGEAFVDSATRDLDNLRTPLHEVLNHIHHQVSMSFTLERDPKTGAGWKELSKPYERRKIKDGYGGQPLLVRTGTMKKTATTGGRVTRYTLTYAPSRYPDWFGSDAGADIVPIHHLGRAPTGKKRSTGMPPRPFFAWTEEDDVMTDVIFHRWLDRLIDRAQAIGRVGGVTRDRAPASPTPSFIFR